MSTEEADTEDSSESQYSDDFTATDGDYEDALTWDSEDSRPPGPSPPSSAMNDSPNVNAHGRLRRRGRRRVYVEPNTQSDDSLMADIYVGPSSSSQEEEERTPSPTLIQAVDSFLRYMEVPVVQPRSPDYPPPVHLVSRSNSPTVEAIPTPPGSPEASPGNQDPEPDIQIIDDPPEQEPVTEPRVPLELSQPSRDEPPDNGTENPPPQLTKLREPSKTLNNSTVSESEEGTLCTICMDPLTNSGNHRVVCLRCGHIFGQSCVERWIKVGCSNGAKRCPTCNKKACLKDIRVLYLPKVIPLDTIEKDRLVQQKEQIIAQKHFVENELLKCELKMQVDKVNYETKIQQLEKDLFEAVNALELLRQGKKITPPEFNLTKDAVRVESRYMVEISRDGGCRVLAFNHILQELVVSQPSGNTVFAGYGVRVLDSVTFLPTRFVYLHQKMIRDLAFHLEDRDLLLSVSLDQTAKLVDLNRCTTVHTFRGEGPLWSCCWDVSNPHLMLVGSQVGKVFQYDRRMLDHYVNMWETKNNLTPVVALASIPSAGNTPFPQGGILSCRLNCVFAYTRHGESYNCQEILSDGPYMSMRYDHSAQSLLTASRPSSRCNYARINMDLLNVDNKGQIFMPEIHKFNCGSSARVMSRLTTFPITNDMLVVGHHESGRSVKLWSSKTGECVHTIPIREPVIDLTSMIYSNNKRFLATLTEKRICLYNVV